MSDIPDSHIANEARLFTRVVEIAGQNQKAEITTGVSIWLAPEVRFGVNQDAFPYAASLGKLSIVSAAVDALRRGDISEGTVVSWTQDDIRAGEGRYDSNHERADDLGGTTRLLIEDILDRSGNTQGGPLTNQLLGGPGAVNTWLDEHGFTRTRLLIPEAQDASNFFLGHTTPREILDIMRGLFDTSQGQDQYHDLIKRALTAGHFADYGIVSQVDEQERGRVASKIGILEAAEDDVSLDPYQDRLHEVALIFGPDGEPLLGYAFLTSGQNMERAKQSLQEMGQAALGFAGI